MGLAWIRQMRVAVQSVISVLRPFLGVEFNLAGRKKCWDPGATAGVEDGETKPQHLGQDPAPGSLGTQLFRTLHEA